VDQAVALLQAVPTSSVYHTRAQVRLGELLLSHKRNKTAYIACFEQLCAQGAGPQADPNKAAHLLLLLGEAYINVQRPDKVGLCSSSALNIRHTDERSIKGLINLTWFAFAGNRGV